MSIATMHTGSGRNRQVNDFYPTPTAVGRALLAAERFHGSIWEAAAGGRHLTRILQEGGYAVYSSDIVTGKDFLKCTSCIYPNIVTNPPFDLAAKFIEHGYGLQPKKMALLLRGNFWHSKKRMGLFERCKPSKILALSWRPDFMELGAPFLDFAWNLWYPRVKVRATIFDVLPRPAEL